MKYINYVKFGKMCKIREKRITRKIISYNGTTNLNRATND